MFLDFLNSFSCIAPMIKFSADAIFVFNETAEETEKQEISVWNFCWCVLK